MKIFGIGLGKTGTTSLCSALSILGYRAFHIGGAPLSVLDEYDAAADSPVARAYKELDAKYPKSKFILTVRDIDSWLMSWKGHNARIRVEGQLPDWVKALRLEFFGQIRFDEDVWKSHYEAHVLEVRSYFKSRPDDLLILDICGGEGWDKLCSFLHLEVPNVPFPSRNSG